MGGAGTDVEGAGLVCLRPAPHEIGEDDVDGQRQTERVQVYVTEELPARTRVHFSADVFLPPRLVPAEYYDGTSWIHGIVGKRWNANGFDGKRGEVAGFAGRQDRKKHSHLLSGGVDDEPAVVRTINSPKIRIRNTEVSKTSDSL